MSNTRKPNATRPNAENPEWTREDMAAARPASEVLPALIGAKAAEKLLLRGKGRPPKEDGKVNQTIRIDPDVLAAYRGGGKGWQALMNEVLRKICLPATNDSVRCRGGQVQGRRHSVASDCC